ncbi:MAG: hypothetical protein HQL51_01525 [Magnetococcales bacterium]|nr:hypothetical protein [Magnetococcales bacterium]
MTTSPPLSPSPPPEDAWREGLLRLLAGETAAATGICLEALNQAPKDGELHYLLGLALLEAQENARAAGVLSRAAGLIPQAPHVWLALGRALRREKRLDDALTAHGQALALDPAQADPLLEIGMILMEKGHPAWASVYLRRFEDRVQDAEVLNPRPVDAYFLDSDQARKAAAIPTLIPRFRIVNSVPGTRLCFHPGPPLPEDPPHLISVPEEGLEPFFRLTPLRRPLMVHFNPRDPEQNARAEGIGEAIARAERFREQFAAAALVRLKNRPPRLGPGEALRILLPSSRHDRDLQYQMRLLARALLRRGARPVLALERPELDHFDDALWRRALEEHQPHAVMSFNRLFNQALHPKQPLIVWWQDPMPILADGEPLPWRERDLAWSLCPEFDDLLRRTGAQRIARQSFRVDLETFRPLPDLPREEKVVVVGSSYAEKLDLYRQAPQQAALRRALGELTERFDAGEPMTDDLLAETARRYGMTRYAVFWKLFHYLVRDRCVRWLCQVSPLPVEVWGNFWERDPLIRPFHRGVLPQGEAVARVYNQARYALAAHPFDLQSQRMGEASACGAIPLVYDCRHRAEPPHWDDACLWFRTAQELREQLGRRPPGDPRPISRDKGYDTLARDLESAILRWLGEKNGE